MKKVVLCLLHLTHHNNKNRGSIMNIKKSAFTLAETLLTLSIIGVIAALTIPALKEYQEEVRYVAATKKAYSSAQAAITSLEIKYGDLKWWTWSNEDTLRTRMKEVLNTLQSNSFTSYSVSYLSGDTYATINNSTWYQTTDGMIWRMYQSADTNSLGTIAVDTNGPSMPNRVGVDVHNFLVTEDGVMPANFDGKNTKMGCTYYAIKKGKMPWINDGSYADCTDERIQGI